MTAKTAPTAAETAPNEGLVAGGLDGARTWAKAGVEVWGRCD